MFVLCVHNQLIRESLNMQDAIQSVSRPDIQDFILEHEDDDVEKLLLKNRNAEGVPMALIAQQIKGRRKAKIRFPLLYHTQGIFYPPSINLEQSSSEATARFKTTLVQGALAADLTAGFGVDAYFFSGRTKMICVEPDRALLDIARHNHRCLGSNTMQYECMTAEQFLAQTKLHFDFLYLDPSRRKESRKVFQFKDTSPDVTQLTALMLSKADQVMIKASPFLDIQKGIRELKSVSAVRVVAVNNECKELLFTLEPNFKLPPIIEAVTIDHRGLVLSSVKFTAEEEKKSAVSYGEPMRFLFEPNAAVLKAGAFKWIAANYRLSKLAPESHLYTADAWVPDFPGRSFRILKTVSLNKKLSAQFEKGYANILTRNFPLKPEEIMKRTGLQEGGEGYLICTRSRKEKIVVIAEKIDLKPVKKSS